MGGERRIVVGVDEAGYGPRLGPLVVGVVAFSVPRDLPDLFESLPVAREDVPVDDSKKVYRGGTGLASLERSVLAFARNAREAVVPDPARGIEPWGLRFPPALPVAAEAAAVDRAAAAVRDALRAAGVDLLALRTRTVPVAEFNRESGRLGSKAGLLFEVGAELFGPFLTGPGETWVLADRHGGRAYYSGLIAARFPELFHLVAEEGRERSEYVFPRKGDAARLLFEVGADGKHLPTALASMAAKYVRELHMAAFNEWFSRADPRLAPTAGYSGDAGRWLGESAEARRRLGVPDEALVRIR